MTAPAPAQDVSKTSKAGSGFVGLLGSTRVATSFGEVPAQLLRKRDMVRTIGGQFLPVLSVKQISFDEEFLSFHPEAHPIMVRAGAFGPDRPKKDAYFAPEQLITSDARSSSNFKRVVDLTGNPKVLRSPTFPISYYVVSCGSPAVIMAEHMGVRI